MYTSPIHINIASVAFGDFLIIILMMHPLRLAKSLQRHGEGYTFFPVRYCQLSIADSSFY